MENASHVLRTDGGGDIGFGHVRRCLSLADAIRDRGGRPEIVLGAADAKVRTHIDSAGHTCRQLKEASRFDADAVVPEQQLAVFDFSHATTRARIDDTRKMFDDLSSRGVRTLLIDAKGAECLCAIRPMSVDVLAIPYAGAENEVVLARAGTDVRGLDYFVLGQDYLTHRPPARQVPPRARKILVTAGGSDPTDLTLFFLDSLELVPEPLDVRIVIGPAFPQERINAIANVCERLVHQTQMVHAPETLSEEMQWADITLSASGLTKYELAFSAAPAILVSIDETHVVANRPFDALGCALDMGQQGEVGAAELAATLQSLIEDQAARQSLADAGPAVIDGQGAKRLLDLLDG